MKLDVCLAVLLSVVASEDAKRERTDGRVVRAGVSCVVDKARWAAAALSGVVGVSVVCDARNDAWERASRLSNSNNDASVCREGLCDE